MKTFLTGGTGFVGGALARCLRAAGHDVIALVRRPEQATALRDLGCTLAHGDITYPDTLADPMQGVDVVFHVAGWYEVGNSSPRAERVNVEGARNVLTTATKLKVPRIVHTSSLAVHADTKGVMVDEDYRYQGPFVTTYDRTKWEAHFEVAFPLIADGAPILIAQPGVIYGPGDRSPVAQLFRRYLTGQLPALPSAAYCWAHVDDIAQGLLSLAERGRLGESYHLSGEPASLDDVMHKLESWTGVPLPTRRLPAGPLRMLAAFLGPLQGFFPLSSDLHPDTLRSAAGVTYLGSNEKARRELGFSPRSIDEGLRPVIEAEARGLGISLPNR